jgi:hypothetical protein
MARGTRLLPTDDWPEPGDPRWLGSTVAVVETTFHTGQPESPEWLRGVLLVAPLCFAVSGMGWAIDESGTYAAWRDLRDALMSDDWLLRWYGEAREE